MITALWLVSALSALAYGVLWVFAPVSPLRTAIKIMPVAALALIAYLTGPRHGVALLLPCWRGAGLARAGGDQCHDRAAHGLS